MLYIVSTLTSLIIEGRFSDMYRRKAMLKQIAKLKNHFIICGANNTAQQAIAELLKRKINFVVIESDHVILQDALSLGTFFHIEGDPTVDENLMNAGIKVARGIIIATPSDETNLYITFAVRELNPSARIISRATEAAAGPRILRAGAHSIVNPDYIGGLRMVSESIRPAVVSFLDIMMRDSKGVFRIEEAHVQQGSELVGKTLGEVNIKERTGTLVLALRQPDSKDFSYNPPDDTKLEVGSILVVLAEVNQLDKLKQLTNEADEFVLPEAV
jgi:voltage-gated potassium channel